VDARCTKKKRITAEALRRREIQKKKPKKKQDTEKTADGIEPTNDCMF